MTTELERLKLWLDHNGHDVEELHKKFPGHGFRNVVNGKRPIYPSFRWYFGREFGNDALREVFDIDLGGDRTCFVAGKQERLWNKDRYAANVAVQRAVLDGLLSPAKSHQCHNPGCDRKATEYHHPSYAPEARLRVIPLCRTCHRRHHSNRNPLNVNSLPVIELVQ